MDAGGDDEVRTEVLDLFWEVTRSFGRSMHEAAVRHDLTPMQSMTLLHIGGGTLPTKDIARHLHCDPSNVTGLVDQLEKRGYVHRVTPPTDRRVRAVEATERGRAVSVELRRGLVGGSHALDRLDAAELTELRRLLRLLAAGTD